MSTSDSRDDARASDPRAEEDPSVRDLAETPDATAPDGSEVRLLVAAQGGSMAHFRLPPGATARAVRHRTVTELWYVVAGRGAIWRSSEGDGREEDLYPGRSIAIPVGTTFQFRAIGDAPLDVVGVTMPPWPGNDEAAPADGPWSPTVAPRSPGAEKDEPGVTTA
ncbi:cupin domain-containing protein [Naasia sp. SYSU D00948]|uniref:cupin domain-containing protein n=1 Tax=Naasia sp. SYSU D00948 TaxID=2817379 RepID=UPI001B31175B|nr:cupin domain-containing protein [Naasia sp. SYSU D00948]